VKATADSWKREPFTTGVAIPYEDRFTETEYEKLKEGLVPREMEDKWFVYFAEPHLFFHRSWTGEPVYRVKLSAGTDGVSVTEALCVSDVLEAAGAAYQGKLLDFLVGNLLLGKAKPFPLPDGFVEPAKGVLQHTVSGTGYPQAGPEPRN
jgi:hypothetical protein